MDLPRALSEAFGLTEAAGRGLAGQVVALIEDQVREQVSFGVASKIRDAVPELQGWQSSTPTLLPGALSLDGLPPPREEGELEATLTRFLVPVARASEVRGLALRFLASRLDAQTVDVIEGVVSTSA